MNGEPVEVLNSFDYLAVVYDGQYIPEHFGCIEHGELLANVYRYGRRLYALVSDEPIKTETGQLIAQLARERKDLIPHEHLGNNPSREALLTKFRKTLDRVKECQNGN